MHSAISGHRRLAQPIPEPKAEALSGEYLGFSALGHLLWEMLQFPLYAIWKEAPAAAIAYAVVHCAVGDVLTALARLESDDGVAEMR